MFKPQSQSEHWINDIKNLLTQFQQRKEFSFAKFKEVWREMKFTLIHEGQREDQEQKDYMKALYTTTLAYLPAYRSIYIKIGVLYTLYLLYETQRTQVKDRTKIIVSLALWEELLSLNNVIKEHKLADAYQIFIKLKKKMLFVMLQS